MKKVIIILTLCAGAFHLSAQNIYSDADYLKAANIIWGACYELKSLDFVRVTNQDVDKKKQETISVLKKSVGNSRKLYETIKLRYQKDNKQIIKLKQWIEVLEKTENDYLLKDNRQTEPFWALGYTMIKMDLEDTAYGNDVLNILLTKLTPPPPSC